MLDDLEEVHNTSARLQYSEMAPPTANLSEIDYHLREVGANGSFTAAASLLSDNVVLEREPVYSG